MFFKPHDPYPEPWFPYLAAIGFSLPAQNSSRLKRWEGMWHVLEAAHGELFVMRGQELGEYSDMRLHEEWVASLCAMPFL